MEVLKEEVSKLVWHPKEFDTDLPVGWHRGIARQTLDPREPKVRPLRPRKDRRSGAAPASITVAFLIGAIILA